MSKKSQIKKFIKKTGSKDPFQGKFMEDLDEQIIKDKIKRLDVKVNMFTKLEKRLFEYYYTNFTDTGNTKDLLEELEGFEKEYKALSNDNVVLKYKTFKKSKFLNFIVKTCEDLIRYKEYIQDKTNLDESFIISAPGIDFKLLYNWSVNWKMLFIDDDLYSDKQEFEKTKKYMLLTANLLLDTSHKIYKIITEPDIDIDHFITTVLGALDVLETKIPRCQKAFRKIRSSVDVMKTNFSGYYRSFVESGNKNIILTDFVQDLIKNNKADLQLVRQFREIMKFLNKMYQNAPRKSKEIDSLLKSLDHFNKIIEEEDSKDKSDNKEETKKDVKKDNDKK